MRQLKNKKGTSIVSVMVAFLILLIGISMLYTSVMLSQNMIHIASEQLSTNDANMGVFYHNRSITSSNKERGVYADINDSQAAFNVEGHVVKENYSGFYYFN